MKFSVSQDQLATSVKAINRCLNRRPHLPILGGIHLLARDGKLTLTTTDTIIGLQVSIPAEVAEPGSVTVAGKNFVETVNFFDDKQTECTLEEAQMLLHNGRDKVKIPVLSDEFPGFDAAVVQSKLEKKPLDFWQRVVHDITFACNTDPSRVALTGVLFRATPDKSIVVGTDGFRLVVWETEERLTQDENFEVIINAKAISDMTTIAELLDEKNVSFFRNSVSEQIIFIGERFTFFSKMINAEFPPFGKIVPLEFATEVTLDREEMLHNLSKASVFAKTESNTVEMHFGPEQAEYIARSLGDGSFHGSQPVVKMTGEPLVIDCNIGYLTAFLNTRDGETVWLGCGGRLTPIMIRDPSVEGLYYVAMPFNSKKR